MVFYGLHATNDGGDHKLCQFLQFYSNSIKLKLVKDLNKLDVTGMVVKTFHTPVLGSTDCPPPSSNSIGVKNSQVLTHAIVACTMMFDINIMPLNSSKDPKVGGPKVKQQKKNKIGARSLIRNTSGVRGHVGALGWD